MHITINLSNSQWNIFHAVSASIAVSDSTDNVNIILGKNYNLSFTINTSSLFNNSLTVYCWHKDGRSTYLSQKYRGVATRTLTLVNTESSDEGTYSLIATDPSGNSSSFAVNLSVGKRQ